MKRVTDGGLLLLVLVGVSAPVGVLVLRALAATWFYPVILPHIELSALGALLHEKRLWRAVGVSLVLALATGAGASLAGYVAARTLSRVAPRIRQAATVAAFLPVVAPPIALGIGLQVLALRTGLAGHFAGVLLAHLVPATGYLTLFFLGLISTADLSIEAEARTLGASPRKVLVHVTWPSFRRRLADGAVLGGLVSWAQLALTLLVGAGTVRTLPVELLSYVRAGDDRLGAAAALLLTLPPAVALGLLTLGSRRTGAVV